MRDHFTFAIRDIYERGEHVYVWTATTWQGTKLEGATSSVRQAYRHAKKAVKRYQKVHPFLKI